MAAGEASTAALNETVAPTSTDCEAGEVTKVGARSEGVAVAEKETLSMARMSWELVSVVASLAKLQRSQRVEPAGTVTGMAAEFSEAEAVPEPLRVENTRPGIVVHPLAAGRSAAVAPTR